MDPNHKAKIQQSIALLQSILGGQSDAAQGPSPVIIPGFDEEIANAHHVSKKLEPEIQ